MSNDDMPRGWRNHGIGPGLANALPSMNAGREFQVTDPQGNWRTVHVHSGESVGDAIRRGDVSPLRR